MYKPEDIDRLKKEKEIKTINEVNKLYEKYGSIILKELENMFNKEIIKYNNKQMRMFLWANNSPKIGEIGQCSFLFSQKIKNEFLCILKNNNWIVEKLSGFDTCSNGSLSGVIHIIGKQDHNKIQEQLERTFKRRFIRTLKRLINNSIVDRFLTLLGFTPKTSLLLHD